MVRFNAVLWPVGVRPAGFALVGLVFAVGCSAGMGGAHYGSVSEQAEAYQDRAAGHARSMPATAPSMPSASYAVPAGATVLAPPPPGDVAEPTPSAPKVIYQGYLKLRVKRLEEAIARITALTEEKRGYIDSLTARVVVVRIPADDFDATMELFATVGQVLSRQVRAVDVTAQFTDIEARLKVSEDSRDRLLALLEQTKDPEERLRILTEVKRLSEQIESMRAILATLQNLVDYFTITIQLEPVLEGAAAATHSSPFVWVRALQPHVATLVGAAKGVRLALPDGFVRFDRDDHYRAQAADTTTLRIGTVKNDPRGDSGFWADAVQFEMDGRDEAIIESGEAGPLLYHLYANKDLTPRYYFIGVHTVGDRVWVVEVFYPSEEAFARHHRAIRDALVTFAVAN